MIRSMIGRDTLKAWLGSELDISFWVNSAKVRKPMSPNKALNTAAAEWDRASMGLNSAGSLRVIRSDQMGFGEGEGKNLHGSFQGGKEYVGGVAEDDHADNGGEQTQIGHNGHRGQAPGGEL